MFVGVVQYNSNNLELEKKEGCFRRRSIYEYLLIAGASSGGEEEHLKSVLVIYLLFINIYVRVRVCALVQARKISV